MGDPMGEKGMGKRDDRGVGNRDSLRPTSESVNDGEEVLAPLRDRKRANQINMHVLEAP